VIDMTPRGRLTASCDSTVCGRRDGMHGNVGSASPPTPHRGSETATREWVGRAKPERGAGGGETTTLEEEAELEEAAELEEEGVLRDRAGEEPETADDDDDDEYGKSTPSTSRLRERMIVRWNGRSSFRAECNIPTHSSSRRAVV
jgi:hypothetical protein